MRKTIIALSFIFLLLAKKALAVCPICSVAVGAGIAVTRLIGLDDSITGLWIGALVMSMALWTVNWLKGRKWDFKGVVTVNVVGYIVLVIVPLYYMDFFGHPLNKLFGVDKLLLGMVIGAIGFTWTALWYEKIKKNNNGHALFPFQKVVMPLSLLTILSLLFFFITA